jgi:hypothetical protein
VLTIKNDSSLLLFDEKLIWLMDCDYYRRCYQKFGKPKILNKISVVNRLGSHQVSNSIVKISNKFKETLYTLKKRYDKDIQEYMNNKIHLYYVINKLGYLYLNSTPAKNKQIIKNLDKLIYDNKDKKYFLFHFYYLYGCSTEELKKVIIKNLDSYIMIKFDTNHYIYYYNFDTFVEYIREILNTHISLVKSSINTLEADILRIKIKKIISMREKHEEEKRIEKERKEKAFKENKNFNTYFNYKKKFSSNKNKNVIDCDIIDFIEKVVEEKKYHGDLNLEEEVPKKMKEEFQKTTMSEDEEYCLYNLYK